ncbi:hypothetical protein ACGFRB_01705 [Streptomyces sp. NPDC048718]|uniref:hypothetical protein n=1 Tax=Streptomyces sp. NPDC048718 TaxID=3365587 RepID=UPI00371B3D05
MAAGTETGTRRSFREMWLVSTLVLFLEAALAVVLIVLFGDVRGTGTGAGAGAGPDTGGGGFGIVFGAVLLPLLLGAVMVPPAAVSAALVVPSVLLGERFAGRAGGPALVWNLLLTAVAAGLVIEPFGSWRECLAGWAGLSVAALIARRARPGERYALRVFLWGLFVVVAVLVFGGLGEATGLIGG